MTAGREIASIILGPGTAAARGVRNNSLLHLQLSKACPSFHDVAANGFDTRRSEVRSVSGNYEFAPSMSVKL